MVSSLTAANAYGIDAGNFSTYTVSASSVLPIEKESVNTNSFDNEPSAELILSNQLINQVKSLSHKALSIQSNSTADSDPGKVSALVTQCSALVNKAAGDDISRGEKTYIQAELNYLKQRINFVDIAV